MQVEVDIMEHESEPIALDVSAVDAESANIDADMTAMDPSSEDGEHVLRVTEEECKDAISQMLDSAEPSPRVQLTSWNPAHKMKSVVHYNGNAIYKSMLVGKLNGNSFLLKDRLTCIKNSVYFSNVVDYLFATNSTMTAFLGLGIDCGMLFMQSPTLS